MSNTKKGSGKKLRAIVGSKGNGSKNLLLKMSKDKDDPIQDQLSWGGYKSILFSIYVVKITSVERGLLML